MESRLNDRQLTGENQQNRDGSYNEKKWRKETGKRRGKLSQTLHSIESLYWIKTTLDTLHPLTLINTRAEIHIHNNNVEISLLLHFHRRSQKNHLFNPRQNTATHSDHSVHGSYDVLDPRRLESRPISRIRYTAALLIHRNQCLS